MQNSTILWPRVVVYHGRLVLRGKRVLACNVVLEQSGYPRSVIAKRAGIERLDLTEEVHVLAETSPVAVALRALDADQTVLAAPPHVRRQCVTEQCDGAV